MVEAGDNILHQKKQDPDYIQVILNLLETELVTPGESQKTVMALYRRLFRYYLKIVYQPPLDDSAFNLPEMRLQSRLTKYLRQALMRLNDPKRKIRNPVVLTPDEALALAALRQKCQQIKEFETHAQTYDFLESSTFSYKPIPALSKYMANTRS
ncbi:MAG: hypothetical protein ACYDBJ_07260 [Aggregatilineales bacterium]